MPKPDIKILLDTNVLIQVEDNRQIEAAFAELIQKCNEHGIHLYVHEASIEDIKRDKDAARQKVTLSKVKKYPLLEKMPCPPADELVKQYGTIKNDNDHVDVRLLHTLNSDVVGLLISEDIGLHERAEKVDLADRVLIVSEALSWIKQTYEPKSIYLPHVETLGCHQVEIAQDIFSSLKEDYPEFENWFKTKCIPAHRDCWTVNEGKRILAIAIWKDETGADFTSEFQEGDPEIDAAAKVLKICTYKVHDEARGSKIGEHLLKQALWHTYTNEYDWVYLTAFENKQSYLISFLKNFGFSVMGRKDTGEIIVAKLVGYKGQELGGLNPLEFHKKFYPHFHDLEPVRKFVIPVKPKYHLKLFPEYSPPSHPTLFGTEDIFSIKEQTSGNAIRKVYLGRPQFKELPAGSLAFFYMSKDDSFDFSQSLTIVGIIDGMTECATVTDLLKVTAKRSVYSHDEIAEMFDGNGNPVKAIDFFIAGHLQSANDRPLILEELIDAGVLRAAPQSVKEINEAEYQILKNLIRIVH